MLRTPFLHNSSGLWAGQSSRSNLLSLMPIHGGPRNMTGGVVILELTMIQPMKLQWKMILVVHMISGVCFGEELTINWDQGSQPIPHYHPRP
ncbi:hypothetical protein TNIN_443021 [Trichonephila inaurata madagascariensis]|uniref:Uncharacterized protein n=1 Tax=Trichonephila inaurata madagascariensis TaxID=2747483 RepID=A0A8X7CFX3_9ARAC|nr:hypothetical protein TNIN_443021 [Trichonephila inaurata madagascariensis]